jgi:formylglycine-generating enzyme required for sulfatase activity
MLNSIGMRLALVPAGTFWMGSPDDEQGRYRDESPLHRVTLTSSFYLGVFAVTQREYRQVMGVNPAWFSPEGGGADAVVGTQTDLLPIDQATWEEASAFCAALSQLPAERAAGRQYRLPTEAEWEYACRAWTTTAYHTGAELTYEDANFADDHCPRRVTTVGAYRPNAFGLSDMHGNVWEWCQDWWGEHYYEVSPEVNPPGPDSGIGHVIRGGSWENGRRYCRCACRFRVPPCNHGVGFRVALTHPG